MTHLKIEQNTTGIEEVSNTVIKKLYDLVYSGTLDNTSNLQGRLHTASTYQSYVDYLTGQYPNLYITANKYYHNFVDPEVERIIATTFGDGIGISRQEIAAITGILGNAYNSTESMFAGNTVVTNLNDLQYFTGVTEITDKFAKGATNLTSVIMPPNITSLSYGTTTVANFGAFRDCTSLSSVTLNEGLQRIMNRCFENCTSLTTIDIPSTCTQIGRNDNNGNNIFYGCTSLTTVTGCEGLDEIGQQAFYDCTALTSIPTSTVTKFDNKCFTNCTSLTNSSINFNNTSSIGQEAFYGCSGLTSVDLSQSSITSVSKKAFAGCPNLNEIKLPTTVTKLGELWCDCTTSNRVWKITGLDNVDEGLQQYNWSFTNCTLLYPLPRLCSNENQISLFSASRNGNATANSIFLPYTKYTIDASGDQYGTPMSTAWQYSCPNTNIWVNIGLLYYKNIQKFGYATFYATNITNLVINNSTPPTYDTTGVASDYLPVWQQLRGDGTRCTIGTLWVPDAAVSTYQNDPTYSGITIKGINTKTNGVDYDLPRYATFADWKVAADAAELAGNPMPVALIEEYM